jgi:hypothetical protein
MNKVLRLLACTCLLAASAASQATTYAFSYTLLNDSVVSGRFDGTANGNLITGLSNFSVFVDGVGFNNNGHLYTYDVALNDDAGVVSFDGLASNVAVSDKYIYGGGAKFILVIGPFNGGPTDTIAYNIPAGNYGDGDGDYAPSSWHISAVPEPETYAMLLGGLALIGARARRRQRAAQA